MWQQTLHCNLKPPTATVALLIFYFVSIFILCLHVTSHFRKKNCEFLSAHSYRWWDQTVVVWHSGSTLVSVNEVNLCRTRLVLG